MLVSERKVEQFTKDELIKRKVIIMSWGWGATNKHGNKKQRKGSQPNDAQANWHQEIISDNWRGIDSNRIRVLSYNEGVNLYKHKGEDEVQKIQRV